jgi:acyl carrier protein
MTIAEAVRDFIMNELHWNARRHQLTLDYPLIEHHVLDSLALMTLVQFLEDRFGAKIDDEELLPENFETISAITELIQRKRSVDLSPGTLAPGRKAVDG